MAQPHVVLQPRPPQVEVAIPETHVFRDRRVFRDLKRRRLRFVENANVPRQDFDLAGGQLRVGGVVRAPLNEARDTDHELRSQPLGDRHQGVVFTDDDLGDTCAIADIDERHAAEVPDTMHPPEQHHFRADIAGTQSAAGMRSCEIAELFRHEVSVLRFRFSPVRAM
jgi:hypothetical protein